jgi:uncharacterized protein (TIGR04168 family)
MIELAIVGDIHKQWSEVDARWFDGAGYHRVIVVGDLAGFRWSDTLRVARGLGAMTAPAVVIPGNHDATHAAQLIGEAAGVPGLGRPLSGGQGKRLEAMVEAIAPHALGAYSLHAVQAPGDEGVTVIAGRPHSMGGPSLAFAPHLEARWGVRTLEESAEKLKGLVDAAPTERLVFAAHNGPTGLGDQPADIWGCDFKKGGGDWGDPDLRAAIDYAQSSGRRVLAVVAGHMHRRARGGAQRPWRLERDGVLYVNAARVPRVRRDGARHHVRLVLDGDTAAAEDRFIEA